VYPTLHAGSEVSVAETEAFLAAFGTARGRDLSSDAGFDPRAQPEDDREHQQQSQLQSADAPRLR
jgi:hypothetical protein